MVSNKLLDSIFNWGDGVTIKQSAPEQYRPGFQGCVCGKRTIDSAEIAAEFGAMIHSELYLIEFNDGETIEIPKFFILLSDEY